MTKENNNRLNTDMIRALSTILDEMGLSEIEHDADGVRIRVVRQVQSAVNVVKQTPTITATSDTIPVENDLTEDFSKHPGVLLSPMVGIAYTSSEPGTPPLIHVGDLVKKGQTLMLIEAMKVFNPITAPQTGKVSRIFVTNGMPVEFNEPLVIIEQKK